ncbi:TIM barrel protein [Chelatococcus sp. SYSU_G07232]|uniref:TIM barrel protein n=1 Tax=Chelatococcus albus TaxID=3047466 RepID=A0ABT7AKD1_9HYPH|nr:TIM barrel protein [Chelatococcus sp. SYSU_G07232]MDJ1159442.1 TIM barrel protein [Chelatococcus sp. SYSU_G07232]
MPSFSANIAFLFADRPFLDRIDAAKAAGFDKVECHFPYEFPIPVLRERLARAGVAMTGLNTAPGDVARGEWGLAGMPGREADFAVHWSDALAYAQALGTGKIHVMAGVVAPEARAAALDTYVANIRRAAREAAAAGVTILLEPLNVRDKPDYLVSRSDEIADLIARVGEANVKLLFDVYHVQIMEGDLIRRLERHRDVIGHVQIAAVPSRHEPDEGEVAYRAIFDALEAIGYHEPIGLEYRPRGRTEDGLGWMRALGVA